MFGDFHNGWLVSPAAKFDRLKNPSRSALCAENWLHSQYDVLVYGVMSSNPAIAFRHVGKACVVFNDLHAKACTFREVPSNVSYPGASYASMVNTYFNFDQLVPGCEGITIPGL